MIALPLPYAYALALDHVSCILIMGVYAALAHGGGAQSWALRLVDNPIPTLFPALISSSICPSPNAFDKVRVCEYNR